MPKPQGPSEFVSEAYQLNDQSDMVDFYRKWASDYDHKMLNELGYISAFKISEALYQYLSNIQSTILDLGCGTGLTCQFLASKGYTSLDGIDLSPDMVRVAGERGIYRELFVGDINKPLEFSDNRYEGVISSGTFTHGHVGPEPLDEVFRILKPGGILACTVHQDLWHSLGFKQKFDNLLEDGIVECVELFEDKYYESGELEGWFCIYRKVSNK